MKEQELISTIQDLTATVQNLKAEVQEVQQLKGSDDTIPIWLENMLLCAVTMQGTPERFILVDMFLIKADK